jgi:hypothetical protein
MSNINNYFCRIFLKPLFIQQSIRLSKDIEIVPMSNGYTCYDSITYIKKYLESLGDPVVLDADKIAREYSEHVPIAVVKMWNVQASDLRSAKELAIEKCENLLNFLRWNQINQAEIFAATATRTGEGTIVGIYPMPYAHQRTFLTNDVPQYARYATQMAERDQKLSLYLSLYADAISEDNPDFKIVKLWTLLETMAYPFKDIEKQKEPRVKKLFEHYEMNVESDKYGIGNDLLHAAYMHRNAIVHEGTANPALVSDKFEPIIQISASRLPEIANDLEETINFLIHLYLKKLPSP